jgi:hypothetical protein
MQQNLHQNALLLLMLTVTGISVYLAIEMRKRMNRADKLINSIEGVTQNIVTQEDIAALCDLVGGKQVSSQVPEALSDDQAAIKIVQPKAKKRKQKNAEDQSV